jgi:5-dehydro-2-deoxygluconokinase
MSNLALYPKFQAYFRTHKPPFLAVWGKNDPFFLPAGAEAFKRDVPEAEVRFFNAGHFALETDVAGIATAIREFLVRWGAIMRLGYDKQLYLVAFDHRSSFSKGLFGATEPLSSEVQARVSDTKDVIFEAFQQAVAEGAPVQLSGVLVDEQFGAGVARRAKGNGTLLAMPVEKSGQAEFQLEYGEDFARHIETFDPDFSKVLVRYNPEGDRELNLRQTRKLARLSEWLRAHDRKFLFELLVPPTPEQLARGGGQDRGQRHFDRDLRADLVVRAVSELQQGGVEPDIWKIEGLETSSDCVRVVAQARAGSGREGVVCIVLGRGADLDRVLEWLAVAAPVPGFAGFAVGRTEWLEALKGYVAGKRSRQETTREISDRYLRMIRAYGEYRTGISGS